MKFCSLMSGSSGNCLYIEDNNTALLIDCGLSGKAVADSLNMLSLSMDKINGILVTHEHIDHSKGLGVLARKYKLPIYISKSTYCSLPTSVGEIPENRLNFISNKDFSIGDFKITPFSTSHDASDPHGFKIVGTKSAYIVTDTGTITNTMSEFALNSDFAFIESNHDLYMLSHGSYPQELKARILSDIGHLPNKEAAEFSVWLASKGTTHIMLGHISDDNNTEELAKKETENALILAGFSDVAKNVYTASKHFPTKIIEF
ncbi:MAG: MBL fold metallo-hydrolase [Clostridia bacterium]|nr:MBL fold metallo-hydrolase [Clostridia bacterium]